MKMLIDKQKNTISVTWQRRRRTKHFTEWSEEVEENSKKKNRPCL